MKFISLLKGNIRWQVFCWSAVPSRDSQSKHAKLCLSNHAWIFWGRVNQESHAYLEKLRSPSYFKICIKETFSAPHLLGWQSKQQNWVSPLQVCISWLRITSACLLHYLIYNLLKTWWKLYLDECHSLELIMYWSIRKKILHGDIELLRIRPTNLQLLFIYLVE